MKKITNILTVFICVLMSFMSLSSGFIANAVASDPTTIAKSITLPANNKTITMG